MLWLGHVLTALLSACSMVLLATDVEAGVMPQPPAGELWTLAGTRPLHDTGAAPAPWPMGTRWTLLPAALIGPPPLLCQQARQSLLLTPPPGLFQGAWPAETAATRAAALGLLGRAVATLRLDCANASFDFHRGRSGQLFTALDGQVLVLQSQPTRGDAQAPVRQLLLQHLAEESAFDAARLARLRAWLAPTLRQAFEAWFARPANPDEAPYLDGDPFTDSQEPPAALSLGELRQSGAQAWQTVFVEFDGGIRRSMVYRLQRQPQGDWRISDIDYGHDTTLLQLLRKDTAPARR
jgi:hypothetical protein